MNPKPRRPNRWLTIALIALLSVPLLMFTPGIVHKADASIQTLQDDFENQVGGANPKGSFYASKTSGATVSWSISATTLTGSTKAIAYASQGQGGMGQITTNSTYIDVCRAGQAFEFDFYIPTGWSSGTGSIQTILSGKNPNTYSPSGTNPGIYDSVALKFIYATTTTVTVLAELRPHNLALTGLVAATMGTVTTGAAYHGAFSNSSDCIVSVGGSANAGSTFGYAFGPLSTTLSTTNSVASKLDTFAVYNGGASGGPPLSTNFYLDNIKFTGVNNYGHGPNLETFEDIATGVQPTRNYYTHTFTQDSQSGDTFIGPQNCLNPFAQAGTGASRVEPYPSKCYIDGGGKTVFTIPSGTSLCPNTATATDQTPAFSFDWGGLFPSVNNGATLKLSIQDALTSPTNYVQIVLTTSGGGTVRSETLNVVSGGGFTFSNSFPISYDWTHWNIRCYAPGAVATPPALFVSANGGPSSLFTSTGTLPFFNNGVSGVELHYFVIDATGTGAGSATTQIDNIDFPTNNAIGAAATTAAFPAGFSLVGADVDYAQRGIIARLASSSQQKIYAFEAGQLSVRNNVPSTCATTRTDGVLSTFQDPPGITYLGFLDCVLSPSLADILAIGDGALNTADHSNTLCTTTGSDFCAVFLDSESSQGCINNGQLAGVSHQIGNLLSSPISYRAGFDEPGIHKNVRVGFVYDTVETTGTHVGVFVQTMTHGGSDYSCFDEKEFSGIPSATSQLCAWRNNADGNDYVSAVGPASPSVTWKIAYGGVDHVTPTGTFTSWAPFMEQVSQLAPALGIGCGNFSNNTLMARADGTINSYRTINGNLGAPLWPTSITDATTTITRQVTVSRNGHWGAYVKSGGTQWAAFNALNGHINATGDMPTGNFKGMWISGNGQDLYIATSTKIVRYHTAPALTIIEQPDNCIIINTKDCVGVGSDTTTVVTPPVNPTGPLPTLVGGSTSATNAILLFAQGIGFTTTNDLFFFGLIMVLSVMCIVTAIIASFSRSRNGGLTKDALQSAVVPALVSGIGIMILNALIGFWQLWTMAVMLICAAGVMAFLVNRLYGLGASNGK